MRSGRAFRVDPRSRGGDARPPRPPRRRWGRSPLTRGRPVQPRNTPRSKGSIPAHAGETWMALPRPILHRVDPRSRGGDAPAVSPARTNGGRSPLTRGRLVIKSFKAPIYWSIPAHAGETPENLPRNVSRGVDPRSRGGDQATNGLQCLKLGRSPLTRGRPDSDAARSGFSGSIPAHAGETTGSRRSIWLATVDPRSRGGDPSSP